MHCLTGPLLTNGISWVCDRSADIRWKGHGTEGLRVRFIISSRLHQTLNDYKTSIERRIATGQIPWLQVQRKEWYLNSERLKEDSKSWQQCPDYFQDLEWLKGLIRVVPELEGNSSKGRLDLQFTITKEDYLLDYASRIFLSHKGANKPKVRRFHKALKVMGFDPWIDEEDMPAGTELHRGLMDGFKDSCAAVFFITPQFVDENYLRYELNLAMRWPAPYFLVQG